MKTEHTFIIHPLPPYIMERDFATNEWVVWSTEELAEVFRGSKEEAQQFKLKDNEEGKNK